MICKVIIKNLIQNGLGVRLCSDSGMGMSWRIHWWEEATEKSRCR